MIIRLCSVSQFHTSFLQIDYKALMVEIEKAKSSEGNDAWVRRVSERLNASLSAVPVDESMYSEQGFTWSKYRELWRISPLVVLSSLFFRISVEYRSEGDHKFLEGIINIFVCSIVSCDQLAVCCRMYLKVLRTISWRITWTGVWRILAKTTQA